MQECGFWDLRGSYSEMEVEVKERGHGGRKQKAEKVTDGNLGLMRFREQRKEEGVKEETSNQRPWREGRVAMCTRLESDTLGCKP